MLPVFAPYLKSTTFIVSSPTYLSTFLVVLPIHLSSSYSRYTLYIYSGGTTSHTVGKSEVRNVLNSHHSSLVLSLLYCTRHRAVRSRGGISLIRIVPPHSHTHPSSLHSPPAAPGSNFYHSIPNFQLVTPSRPGLPAVKTTQYF